VKFGVIICLVAAVIASSAQTSNRDDSGDACGKGMLFKVHNIVAWASHSSVSAFFFNSGLAIDADGAFKAYHPQNRPGLDSLAHAGHPGEWWAVVTDTQTPEGRPVVQQKSDPAPGYYISMTSLVDPNNKNWQDPHKYVDSMKIPYIALSPRALKFARLGDFATVVNLQNGKISGAIVADTIDPSLPLGEGSIALAKALGIDSDPRTGGRERQVIFYVVYPHSGNGTPRTVEDIMANSQRLFESWGGLDKLNACAPITVPSKK